MRRKWSVGAHGCAMCGHREVWHKPDGRGCFDNRCGCMAFVSRAQDWRSGLRPPVEVDELLDDQVVRAQDDLGI